MKRKPVRNISACFLFLGLFAAMPQVPGMAQQAGVQTDRSKLLPRVLVLYFGIHDKGFPSTIRFLAYESLAQELRLVLPDVVIIEPARSGGSMTDAQFPPPPETAAARNKAARDLGGDAYLLIEVSGDVPNVDVRYEFSDLLVPARSTSGSYKKVLDSRFRNLNSLFWIVPANVIKDRLKPREQLVDVTFTGLPGTVIAQPGTKGREVTLGAGPGSPESDATVRVAAPGAYRFRASLPGYYPSDAGVTVDQNPVTVPIDLRKKSLFTFDFTLTDLSFPALSASYQILPETLFVRATFETYLLSIIPFGSTGSDYDRNNSNRPFFLSLGSSMLKAAVGTYLAPQHGFWGVFRPYVMLGPFVRLVSMKGYWGIDPLIPAGAQLDLGFELLPESKLRGIIAFSPRIYLAPDTALAASGLYDPKQFWRFKFLDGFILQIPTMYVGVRFQP